MDTKDCLRKAYQSISELLQYPEEIDGKAVRKSLARLAPSLSDIFGEETARLLIEFAHTSESISAADYIDAFELNPKHPLYLGYYTCRQGGPDGRERRRYMCEMIDIYQFYGLRLEGREYPDFLPAAVECLWFSLDHEDRTPRFLLVRDYILPAMPHLEEGLAKAGSPYASLMAALRRLLEADLELMTKEETIHAVPG